MSAGTLSDRHDEDGRRLRLLRLTPFFHHDNVDAWPARYDPVGGQQTQCLAQSLWLAARGVDQLVLTFGFPGVPNDYWLHPGLRIRRARYPMPEWPSRTTGLVGLTPNWYWATRALCRQIRGACDWQPDLVHVHGDGQIEALRLVPWAKRLFGCPVVLTIHCSRLASYKPMNWIDALRHDGVQMAERRAVAASDLVICLNPQTRRTIEAQVPATANVHALPDIIDIAAFRCAAVSDAARSAQAQFARPDGRKLVTFVGRIAHEKGWSDVVQLMRDPRARDWRVLFVGDGPQRGELEAAVDAAGLRPRCTITGFVSRDAVAGLLATSDLVVMPSVHEEFGGVAIEAMALGVAAVGYAVGGLRSTLGALDSRLLVAPSDQEALVDRAAAVLADAPWARDAMRRAEAFARSLCDADAVMPRLLALYATVSATPLSGTTQSG